MKFTVVDESLSSFKPMYCSREYQASTRLSQQYEKSTSNYTSGIILFDLFLLIAQININYSMIKLWRMHMIFSNGDNPTDSKNHSPNHQS